MKNRSPKVSIVVPVYNSITHIQGFLKSLLKTDYNDFEVIIIDDNSSDGTKEYLAQFSKKNKRIKVIETLVRKGLTKSRNLGIEVASGEFIAFAEVDMLFDRNWLTTSIEALRKDNSLGGVCGKVLDIKSKRIINAVGIMTIPNIGWVVSRGIGEKDKGQYDAPVESNMGSVGSVVRLSALRKIRGFDEELDRIDDTDFGWRMWILGYRIVTVPSSITYHVVVKKWNLRKRNVTMIQQEMSFCRTLRMLFKNYELKNLIFFSPQALTILLGRAVVNLFKGNIYSLIGFFLSIVWFVKTLPSTLRERSYLQKNRVCSDKEIFGKIMVTNNLIYVYRYYVQDVYKRLLNVPAIG